ncbi:MAG: excinuclease ABC subunit UvrA [Deltaproteobacteria bacterium]|nr:excinuclease ABC subunit UvrA [Deltaproteobacteria bacterium]
MADPSTHIVVTGAREHNLQGVDVAIPRDALTVITGVSGSGKSSLAFDTIYQEGQRRYLESLSAYARQFLGTLEKPRVERVDGLSPTLAIDQKGVNRNPRSTVGTATEILDHLRLWMARLGVPHCPVCGREIAGTTPTAIVDRLLAEAPGARTVVMGPVVRERKGEYRKEIADLVQAGYTRARIDGVLVLLDEAPALARYETHTLEVVTDRLVLEPDRRERLLEAVEQALDLGRGVVTVLVDDVHRTYATARSCPDHDVHLPELEPRLFSFNTPQGACPACDGLGVVERFDPDLLMDPAAPAAAACRAMSSGHLPFFTTVTEAAVAQVIRALGADPDTPFAHLPAPVRQVVLFGGDVAWTALKAYDGPPRQVRRAWKGLVPQVARIWQMTRYEPLDRFRRVVRCEACGGTRLNPVARAVTVLGHTLPELVALPVAAARRTFDGVSLRGRDALLGEPILREIRHRLRFLDDVGLGYLGLDRAMASLSGGEAQRIRLAAQVGSGLQGVTYVLDEPSVGLHPRDQRRLLDTLLALRDQGNTVLVVEHDVETVLSADHLLEIGPGAGRAGGRVVAEGPLPAFLAEDSLTGAFLKGERRIPVPLHRRTGNGKWIQVIGARARNLRDVDVAFPLGCLTVVTGVSGSGKSTLLLDILEPALACVLQGARRTPEAHDRIEGIEHLDKVICIDQQPIGRTPRSNPATYTGAAAGIRNLFARLPDARARGWGPGRFSFNVPGGRCERCQGAGVITLEMQILADVTVPCEDCGGRRFNAETLEVRWRGRSITDVLEMTVSEALDLFHAHPAIRRPLEALDRVGLGYVALGQPSTTLSGGEAQRIKLARELQRPPTGRTLYLLDEPTTGLHLADVARLLEALQALVDAGNTVVVIEHHTDVIKVADHVVDLGPGGGDAGGRVVGEGPPEVLARLDTPTGRVLAALPDLGAPDRVRLAAEGRLPRAPGSHGRDVVIRGARRHNLKGVDAVFPYGKMTVVTGVSGSGKTSLALHTLFTEGQRRYVESLSTYARRFLGRLDRAPVDSVEGLAPSIAIAQQPGGHNPRSTVATVTEIHDLLRLMWARVGRPHCHRCGRPLLALDPSSAARFLAERAPGPGRVVADLGPAQDAAARRRDLGREGFVRLWDGQRDVGLEDPEALALLDRGAHLVIDRLDPAAAGPERVAEAVRVAYGWGGDRARFVPAGGEPLLLLLHAHCPEHGAVLPDPLTPRHFSFNSHAGACPRCEGLGETGGRPCPACGGDRLRPEVLGVLVGGLSIAAFCRLTVAEAIDVLDELPLTPRESAITAQLLPETRTRLGFLGDVGLDYLTLDRRAHTLSSGEAQRIRLAGQVGGRLTGTIYVLDEPSVGLHPRDVDRLLATLERLRDLGNTVVVVEHDSATIRRADHVIDLGPGAGEQGGEVVAAGTPAEIAACPASLTGAWLSGARRIAPRSVHRAPGPPLVVRGARGRNLKGIDVAIPTAAFTVVTGVSGAGKSSLVMDTLGPALRRVLDPGRPSGDRLPCDGVEIPPGLRRVVEVEAAPMGRTPRSCPATVTKLLDPLRALFARLPGAQVRGLGPADFSYNARGRCPACEGRGSTLVEMHFLSDVWVPCEACGGRRYRERVLEVRWQGRSIADVLDLTVDEACGVFAHHRRILRPIAALGDVGLGYLRLGQPGHTLSSGEMQRIKLAMELIARAGPSVYLLDEPTVGLHPADVERLLGVLHGLVDRGDTVVVIEHDLDVVRSADHVVDLGPEGGEGGGRIVAEGSPAAIAACPDSWTGRALAGGPIYTG